jgi:hypothetical protein
MVFDLQRINGTLVEFGTNDLLFLIFSKIFNTFGTILEHLGVLIKIQWFGYETNTIGDNPQQRCLVRREESIHFIELLNRRRDDLAMDWKAGVVQCMLLMFLHHPMGPLLSNEFAVFFDIRKVKGLLKHTAPLPILKCLGLKIVCVRLVVCNA